MDLDLNQEPSDLVTNLVSGPSGDEVEERIRLLEVVYARSRWRQTRHPPQNPLVNDMCNEGRGVKRNSSDLVAKALSLDMGVRKVVGDGKGFFDCNICLSTVRDPVLTCCGHLFCWSCFYTLPYAYANAKECPVCKGEVTEATVTPIYGNGKGAHAPESGLGEVVPPRPRAKRIEVVRQNCLTNRMYTIPVADVLRRIRIEISGPAGRHVPPPTTDGPRRHRSRLIERALSEVDDLSPSSMLPRMFSTGDFLVGSDDVAADETHNGSSVGFLLESPVADTATVADLTVNDAQMPSTLRRRDRESRVRRRRLPGH